MLGIGSAMLMSQAISGLLFGVSPLDPLGVIGAVVFVAIVALAAGGLAGRRAARVDPRCATIELPTGFRPGV